MRKITIELRTKRHKVLLSRKVNLDDDILSKIIKSLRERLSGGKVGYVCVFHENGKHLVSYDADGWYENEDDTLTLNEVKAILGLVVSSAHPYY